MRPRLVLPVARFALALCASALASARGAAAQAAGSTVGGVVTDSLDRAPLAGAVVQLVSADSVGRFGASVTSDSLGRFSFAGVPRGRYALGFFHPLLDSLGLGPPLREVRVDRDGETLRADVAIPGPERMRATICGAKSVRDSTLALVTGTVRGASDGAPASGATVDARWLEYSLGEGGIGRRIGHLTATTADNGWFALCGVPSAGSVALMATRGSDSTDRIEVAMGDGGFLRRDLYLGAARAVSVVDTADGNAVTYRRRAGDLRLSGVVVRVDGGKPLAGARVGIVDGPGAVANERGEWAIAGAPPGTRLLEVHAVGYYPEQRAVDVVAGAPPVRIAMRTLKAVLDTVRIVATRLRTQAPLEFEMRRRSGAGHYLTQEMLQHRRMLRTSDAFRNQAGVSLVHAGVGRHALAMRGIWGACRPTIYIDGHWFEGLDVDDLDTMVNPKDITGIEIYDETTAPPQYRDYTRETPCGSIVIWTTMAPGR